MVEQWIELSEVPLDVLHDLVNTVLPRFEEEGKLEEHPLLKADTIVQFYQASANYFEIVDHIFNIYMHI